MVWSICRAGGVYKNSVGGLQYYADAGSRVVVAMDGLCEVICLILTHFLH